MRHGIIKYINSSSIHGKEIMLISKYFLWNGGSSQECHGAIICPFSAQSCAYLHKPSGIHTYNLKLHLDWFRYFLLVFSHETYVVRYAKPHSVIFQLQLKGFEIWASRTRIYETQSPKLSHCIAFLQICVILKFMFKDIVYKQTTLVDSTPLCNLSHVNLTHIYLSTCLENK